MTLHTTTSAGSQPARSRDLRPQPAILGLGLAVPPTSISQDDAATLAVRRNATTSAQRNLVRRLHDHSGVDRRGTVLGPSIGDFYPEGAAVDVAPTTGERMQRYEAAAPALACAAARSALTEATAHAALSPDAVTHLVITSCTGFSAPGVDIALIDQLGLPRSVARTMIGFMGCHAAINALRVARDTVAADPNAVVLVVAVELCTLHFAHGTRPDAVVANSLFGDGAAAALVGWPVAVNGNVQPTALRACGSWVFPNSSGAMSWSIGDHGFAMSLSRDVPGLIARELPGWLDPWLAGQGVSRADIQSWIVHPGGPRILDAVADALALPDDQLAHSRAVLRAHGNMSSATVFHILARMQVAERRGPAVMLAFGPGLTAEAALLNLSSRSA